MWCTHLIPFSQDLGAALKFDKLIPKKYKKRHQDNPIWKGYERLYEDALKEQEDEEYEIFRAYDDHLPPLHDLHSFAGVCRLPPKSVSSCQ